MNDLIKQVQQIGLHHDCGKDVIYAISEGEAKRIIELVIKYIGGNDKC